MNTTLTAPQQLIEETLPIPKGLDTLEKSIYVSRIIDIGTDILRPLVYRVFSEKLWEGRFSSFTEYIESPEGLNKSQGYGSKLKNVELHFVIEGGATPEQLQGIDYECLYYAKNITQFKQEDGTYRKATIEDQISIARTLNRQEIQQTLSDQSTTPHEHTWITYCDTCRQRKHDT